MTERIKKSVRKGFTLIEILVVIAIIAMLLSLLMAGVQSARMAAARAQCQNHLKQMGLAMFNFDVTNGRLPPAGEYLDPATKATFHTKHSFFTHLLPFVEQGSVARNVDMALRHNEGANAALLAGAAVPVFLCPVNPARSDELDPQGYGCVDYATAPYTDIDPATGVKSSNPAHRAEGALGHPLGRKVMAITDGSSNCVAVYEDVGRSWVMSASRYNDPVDNLPRRFWRWAEPDNAAGLSGKINNCQVNPADPNAASCAWINHDIGNNSEPYSFHPGGGVHILFCDGSVRWTRDTVSPLILRALVTFNGNDRADVGESD